MARVLIACESSGVVRRAFRDLGHDAWSADLLEAEDGSPHHIVGDVREVLNDGWDGMVAHPPCTRLTNSGVRWLHEPPPGKTKDQMWSDMRDGADLYLAMRDAPIRHRAIENPIFHVHARRLINPGPRQVIQPWWFGEPFFKATGLELINLPRLFPTRRLRVPRKGTEEHRQWSAIHLAPPGPDRWRFRSRTFPGIAAAMAEQWGPVMDGVFQLRRQAA